MLQLPHTNQRCIDNHWEISKSCVVLCYSEANGFARSCTVMAINLVQPNARISSGNLNVGSLLEASVQAMRRY